MRRVRRIGVVKDFILIVVVDYSFAALIQDLSSLGQNGLQQSKVSEASLSGGGRSYRHVGSQNRVNI